MKAGEVLKTDVLGRVKTPKERRKVILDEFERSGLSGRKFAEVIGVNYQTFAGWVQRQRRERKEYSTRGKTPVASTPQLHWVEAVVEKAGCSSSTGLVVHLPGGARMEIVDAAQATLAAVVLRSLENKPHLSC